VLGSEAESLRKAKEMLESLADAAAAQEGKTTGQGAKPQQAEEGKPGEAQQSKGQKKPSEQAGDQPVQGGKGGPADEEKKEGEPQKAMAAGEAEKPGGEGKGEGKGEPGKDSSKDGKAQARNQKPAKEKGSGSGEGGYFFEEGGADYSGGSETFSAEGFRHWSDQLRNVEDLLPDAAARNELAKVMDTARDMRLETKRSNQPPQVAAIQARIIQPLLELRDAVAEELARKESKDQRNKTPIDRDPVPQRFQDMVRRYYEQLGSGEERRR
jgi:hypothetical protein